MRNMVTAVESSSIGSAIDAQAVSLISGLGNLAADQRPDLLGESLAPDRGNAARGRKALNHCEEPVGSAVAGKALDLGKISLSP